MACPKQHVWSLCVLFAVIFTLEVSGLGGDDLGKFPLLMPNVKVQSDEAYMCHQFKMDSKQANYIVGFEPNATMSRAHHVLIYGCKTPGTKHPVWNCGHEEKAIGLVTAPICDLGTQVVYAWARDAPQLELPEGVGFEVGGDSQIQYLVLQVHYAHKLPDNVRDNSGVILSYTRQKVPRQAGVLMVSGQGVVQPHKIGHWEAACPVDEDKTVHPFAYRVHTHGLGVSVSGYRVRRGWDGNDVWTLLGRRDPQLPEMFVPVIDDGTIVNGDYVATRCTMNNFRNKEVWIGLKNSNEMCILYLMYWVEGDSPLQTKFCNAEGFTSTFAETYKFNHVPAPDSDGKRPNKDPR